jgi:hypothetical protein
LISRPRHSHKILWAGLVASLVKPKLQSNLSSPQVSPPSSRLTNPSATTDINQSQTCRCPNRDDFSIKKGHFRNAFRPSLRGWRADQNPSSIEVCFLASVPSPRLAALVWLGDRGLSCLKVGRNLGRESQKYSFRGFGCLNAAHVHGDSEMRNNVDLGVMIS